MADRNLKSWRNLGAKRLNPSSRFLISAFLVSFLIHMALGIPIFKDAFDRTPRPAPGKPIEIEILQPSKAATAGAKAPTMRAKAAKAPRSTALTDHVKKDVYGGGFFAQHLMKSTSSDISVPSEGFHGVTVAGESREATEFSGDPMGRLQTSAQGWSGAVQYGNAMDLSFTLESLEYFNTLYDRVNSQLVYPDDFSRQRITGRVRIEAELSRDGKLIRFLSSTADDRLLQTYCFAVLMQILSRPLPERAWLPFERANVAFDFDFRIRIPKEPAHAFAREVQKNRLGFSRENEVDPWLNEKFNEIITHYVPPIIPIPGGFYIDLIAAYQFVNNLIEGTPTESEQRQARIEKLHEALRGTVHRNSPTPTPSPAPES